MNKFKSVLNALILKVKKFFGKYTEKMGLSSGGSKKKKLIFIIVVVAIVVLIIGMAVHSHNVKKQKEQEVALKNIFALGHLPVDEDPASSVVKNLDAVKDSPFFKDAQVGDIILFFKKARMAGILRPSTGKIINSALVVGEIPKEFKDIGGEATPTVNVAIFNATKTSGLADKEAKILSDAFKGDINIVFKDSARKDDMQVTTVVDLSGQNSGLANAISVLVGGVKGDFPPGEKLPPSMQDFPEILIFLGASTK